jgi:transposase
LRSWYWRWSTGRRIFTRKYKREAVRLVTERGVSMAQASRDLGVHINSLRDWVVAFRGDPEQASQVMAR